MITLIRLVKEVCNAALYMGDQVRRSPQDLEITQQRARNLEKLLLDILKIFILK